MGMRQTRNFSDQTRDLRDRQSASKPVIADEGEVPQAVSYSGLAAAKLQPNAEWTNVLTNLPLADDSRVPVSPLTPRERRIAVSTRNSRRAYDGAPPTVPHAITQRSAGACMTCHGNQGGQPVIAGKVPPRMSHAFHASCTQCHVPAGGPGDGVESDAFGIAVANDFEGRDSSGKGARAHQLAPPTIPHHTLMREDCYSCHGAGRVNAITTSHPDRQSCTQCHAPSAAKDQRLIDLEGVRQPIKFPVDLHPPAPEPAVTAPEPPPLTDRETPLPPEEE